jgi:hypothetical protein
MVCFPARAINRGEGDLDWAVMAREQARRYPRLSEWFSLASARNSYKEALEGWESQALFDMALPILDRRSANGDGISDYGPLPS